MKDKKKLIPSFFLPLQFVRRLLNFRAPEDEFSSDDEPDSKLADELEEIGEDNGELAFLLLFDNQFQNSKPFSVLVDPESAVENSSLSMQSETPNQQFVSDHEYRIAVGSWNVAGLLPPDDIDLHDWLDTTPPADIYVIGFQEIVPLIACNVVCVEDEAPIPIWEGLICHTLNNKMEVEDDKESATFAPSISSTSTMFSSPCRQNQFLRIVSKQMVGIYITIWIRSDLRHHVHDIKVCSVGCGIFNYLGNKGAVSVSLCLHQTSFCFVCTHLKSGLKEGDELRRNADVAEILHRTKFPRLIKQPGIELPKTIMTHDQIIWLGDLNYRIDATDEDTWALVDQGAWECLLQKDQLKLEQRAGHVFEGWNENPICFPPTYKFIINSDEYFGRDTPLGAKRRTPAWCDRILWYGKGLRQLEYKHIESQLSDHRPVSSTFMAEVEIASHGKLKPTFCRNSKVEAEELRPTTLIPVL
ncbi:unnamed protein product [Sphagnum troendelagicum]|uniref:Inositol polyphosphate-related phosphatase domain-containing protein n=1 Tax=Sphagnum jensenii TaxID=128206 RepID=A0ABP0VP31_9BRYO